MRYDDRVRFTRAAEGGSQDPDSGVWTPADPTVLYDGICDAQDVARVLRRDETGLATLVADLSIFLPWEAGAGSVREEDDAAVTFADGGTLACKVVGTRHLDRIIFVKAP